MSIRVLTNVLETSPQEGSARLVLIALAWHADEDGVAWPSIATIAKKAMVHPRTVQRVLPELVAAGELAIHPGEGRNGTSVYRLIAAGGQQLALLPRAVNAGGGTTPVTAVSYKPSVPLVDKSDGVREGSSGRDATPGVVPPPLSALREIRETKREAELVWLGARKQHGCTRFTDSRALRKLRDRVGVALDAGAIWEDIEPALRDKAHDPNANPWYADEWIGLRRDERQRRERLAREQRERIEVQRRHDADVEHEWRELERQHPGKTRSEIVRLRYPSPAEVKS